MSRQLLAEVRRLKLRKHRRHQGKLVLEGVRLVREALEQEVTVAAALYSPELLRRPGGSQLLSELAERRVQLVQVEDSALTGLSDVDTCQGIVAVAGAFTRPVDATRTLRLLVDGVQDPGNLGTIIRCAHAAAVGAVYLGPGTVDPFGPKTLRAAMGSVFAVPLLEMEELAGGLERQRALGYRLVVADTRGRCSPGQLDLTGRVLLAVGNEARGVTPPVRERADALVRIPMPGGAESLNVAMAATILLYEAVRQRHSPGTDCG
ncbi:MAG TPA: RNA methyltransferase [Clostridiales bacterium UBA8153]|nr:RNA methyltransferase [Clostridiales bacterium UBA8153]